MHVCGVADRAVKLLALVKAILRQNELLQLYDSSRSYAVAEARSDLLSAALWPCLPNTATKGVLAGGYVLPSLAHMSNGVAPILIIAIGDYSAKLPNAPSSAEFCLARLAAIAALPPAHQIDQHNSDRQRRTVGSKDSEARVPNVAEQPADRQCTDETRDDHADRKRRHLGRRDVQDRG